VIPLNIGIIYNLIECRFRILNYTPASAAFYSKAVRRFASTIGSFSFLWKLINNLLQLHRQKADWWNPFIAGAVSASAVLFNQSKDDRIEYAHQIGIRAAQAASSGIQLSVPHMDSLLFIFSCGSIMYCKFGCFLLCMLLKIMRNFN
jgi:hypothetical protein